MCQTDIFVVDTHPNLKLPNKLDAYYHYPHFTDGETGLREPISPTYKTKSDRSEIRIQSLQVHSLSFKHYNTLFFQNFII